MRRLLVAVVLGIAALSLVAATPARKPAAPVTPRDPALAAQDVYSSAMSKFRTGQWASAALAFDRAHQLDPAFSPALLGRAYVALAQNDLDGAIDRFRRTIAIDSLGFEPRVALFFSLYRAGHTDEAIEAFEDMVLNDMNEHGSANQSWTKHALFPQEPSQSAAEYLQAYAQDSTNALTILLHGNALLASGDGPAANSDYRLALARDPRMRIVPMLLTDEGGGLPDSLVKRCERVFGWGLDYGALRKIYAVSLMKLGRTREALVEFDRAATMLPRAPEPRADRALLLARNGRPQEAEHELAAALERLATNPDYYSQGEGGPEAWQETWARRVQEHPDDVVARILLGNAQLAAGDAAGALESHRKAAELAPGSAVARLHYGTTCAANQDDENALAALQEAARLDPALTAAHGALVAVHVRRQHAADALSELDAVLRAVEQDGSLYRFHAVIAAQVGKRSVAYADIARALTLDPSDAEAYRTRADIRRQAGDRKGEIIDLTQALEIQPEDADAHSRRAAAYRATGNLTAARADEAATRPAASNGGSAAVAPGPGGSHMQMCTTCGGMGRVNCNFCFGMGKTNCSYCGGSGRDYSSQQTCNRCYGSGKQNCNFCYGSGKKMCIDCGGTGYVRR